MAKQFRMIFLIKTLENLNERKQNLTTLFDETSINGMTLRNRIVKSAMWEGMCDENGRPNEKLIKSYVDLAQGGVGLIITGYAYVRPEGKQLKGSMGIYTDDFADDYKELPVLFIMPEVRLQFSWFMLAARLIPKVQADNHLRLRPFRLINFLICQPNLLKKRLEILL